MKSPWNGCLDMLELPWNPLCSKVRRLEVRQHEIFEEMTGGRSVQDLSALGQGREQRGVFRGYCTGKGGNERYILKEVSYESYDDISNMNACLTWSNLGTFENSSFPPKIYSEILYDLIIFLPALFDLLWQPQASAKSRHPQWLPLGTAFPADGPALHPPEELWVWRHPPGPR